MKEKSIKTNIVLNTIKVACSIAFPLITFPYISRVLQPNNVGKVNFGSSFVSYFSLIASLGIATYAIRECSAARNDRNRLSDTSSQIFSINICTTIVAYIFLALTLLFFDNLASYRKLIYIQSTSILFTTLGADWLNTAMEDFKYITIRSIVFQIISLILMFIFVREEADYLKYAAITVFSTSAANIANIFYRKKFCNISFTLDMHLKRHLKPIVLLFVMLLAQTIFSSADVTMLGIMKDDFEVGIYSTAHKIENIISQVVSSLAWVVMPRMSVYFEKNDYEKINNLLHKTLDLLMFIGIPSLVGVCVLSKEIVIIVGGNSYIDSALPLTILMMSFFFSLIGGSFLGNMVLLPSKNEKQYMIICCVTAVINIVLNFLLIPFGGAWAAALTTTMSSFLIMVMLILKKDKKIKLDYVKDSLKEPIIGSIIILLYCTIIGYYIHHVIVKTFVCVIGSFILYGISMIYLKNSLCIQIMEALIERRRSRNER